MKTGVVIKCDMHVTIGKTTGCEETNLKDIREHFFNEAKNVIDEALKGSNIRVDNMKMFLTMEDS